VSKNLKNKLFNVDDIFRPIVMQHRIACLDLEQLRVIDLTQGNRDSYSIKHF
jgi:hypothetical protein